MKTDSETGRRWVVYLKAAAFLLPAVAFWVLTVIFIVPKLQQICADAGGQPLPGFIRGMMILSDHGVLLLIAMFVGIGLLEWFSDGWARYRKMATGIAVFVANSVILCSFFVLLVTFAMVAPALIRAGP